MSLPPGQRFRIVADRRDVIRRLKRVEPNVLWMLRQGLAVASSVQRPAFERYRTLVQLLDVLGLLLYGLKGARYALLLSKKCRLSDVGEETNIGEYILNKLYASDASDVYFGDRVEELLCLAEAAYAILLDARLEEE